MTLKVVAYIYGLPIDKETFRGKKISSMIWMHQLFQDLLGAVPNSQSCIEIQVNFTSFTKFLSSQVVVRRQRLMTSRLPEHFSSIRCAGNSSITCLVQGGQLSSLNFLESSRGWHGAQPTRQFVQITGKDVDGVE